MGRFRQRYELIFWFGAGVVISTILSNRLFSSGLVNYQMLYQYVRQGWINAIEKRPWAAAQILLVRGLETVAIWLICQRYRRRLGIFLLLLAGGGVVGLSVVLMTWSRGAAGIFYYLLSSFPQGLCYIPAWLILIFQALSGYEIHRGKFWSAVLALVLLGILAEILINPFFLRFV